MKNCSISNEFNTFIQQLLTELEKDENIFFTNIFLQVNVLFVFQYQIFGNIDKKLVKRIMDINKRVRYVILIIVLILIIRLKPVTDYAEKDVKR